MEYLIEAFRLWLYLPDPTPLVALVACVVANHLVGDPIWLMLVGPPSSGKTELIGSLARLPRLHMASTLTEQSLLSGTSARERALSSTGGLLRQIGEWGILLLKDFTSILSMHREKRSALLAALREIYDQKWSRHIGVDGGKVLSWSGHLGLIAGCTDAIDSHHAVMAHMGERFLFLRMPQSDEREEARMVLGTTGREAEMRQELEETMAGFFASLLEIPEDPPSILPDEEVRLVALATLAVCCRSAVERDPYKRDIVNVPQRERPGRMLRCLSQLSTALKVMGVPPNATWAVVCRLALDSMPATRRKAFDAATQSPEGVKIAKAKNMAGVSATLLRRGLEELEAHGILDRRSEDRSDVWSLSAWASALLEPIGEPFPESQVLPA
jgi:hypothetical protein